MLIMNSRKMIYVHLQKCGGTSVELSLEAQCCWNDILLGSSQLGEMMQWHYFNKYGLHKHSAASEILQAIGQDTWSEYYSWCTVRNPYSRITSLYSYAAYLVYKHAADVRFPIEAPLDVQRQWAAADHYPRSEPWSFPAVKALLLTRSHPQPYSAYLRSAYLEGEDGCSPQWWGVQSRDGTSMAVSEFVKLEDLPKRWPELCERLRLAGTRLQLANATPRQFRIGAKKFFRAPEDVAFVNERYAEDFERFGYQAGELP